MHRQRVLLIIGLAGCGGTTLPTNTGVRQRIVATVPTEHITVLPAHPSRPGHVRFGVAGGVPFARTTGTASATDGARFEPVAHGEAYVAVGMPGHHRALDRDVRASWELVGSVLAAPAPSSRTLATDPALTVPDRDILGGSLGVTGAIGDHDVTLAGSFTVRDVAMPFAWDYGDCEGGPSCPLYMRKGLPAEGMQHGLGVSGAVGVRKLMQRGLSVLASAGFDVAPTFEVAARASVLCDANGNCSGGRMPETPETSHDGLAYGLFGIDAEPSRFTRVYVVVVPVTTAEERRIQMRLGVEARF